MNYMLIISIILIVLVIPLALWMKFSKNSSEKISSHPFFGLEMMLIGALISTLLGGGVTYFSEKDKGTEKAIAQLKTALLTSFDEVYYENDKISQSRIDPEPFKKILNNFELHKYYDESFIDWLNYFINSIEETNEIASEKETINDEFETGYFLLESNIEDYFTYQYLYLKKEVNHEEYLNELKKIEQQMELGKNMMLKN